MATSRVLVYGGKGALGAAVVNYFKGKNWVCFLVVVCWCSILLLHTQWVLSVDLFQNDQADANVRITTTSDWVEQGREASWSPCLVVLIK